MSIESNMKSIAESLAIIAAHLSNPSVTVEGPAPKRQAGSDLPPAPKRQAGSDLPPAPTTDADVPVVQGASAPSPGTAPAAQATPGDLAPMVAPAPAVTMTVEELNAALVVEFRRLGGREGIDKAMADLGASSVNQLAVEQYAVLIATVKALQP